MLSQESSNDGRRKQCRYVAPSRHAVIVGDRGLCVRSHARSEDADRTVSWQSCRMNSRTPLLHPGCLVRRREPVSIRAKRARVRASTRSFLLSLS